MKIRSTPYISGRQLYAQPQGSTAFVMGFLTKEA